MAIILCLVHLIEFHNPQVKIGCAALPLKADACIPNDVDQIVLTDFRHDLDVQSQITIVLP